MRFRKKPVVIEAVQWNGQNFNEVSTLMNRPAKTLNRRLRVHTLNGAVYADEGEWICKGIKGEIYPCKPDIFEATYEME